MSGLPTPQERQEARLERLIAHEQTQIKHLSLAAPDKDGAWRATREAAIARCRVRLAGYIAELEEAVQRKKETSASSAARPDSGEPPSATVNAAGTASLRRIDALPAQHAARAWWQNHRSTSGARSDSGEPPSETGKVAGTASLRRIDAPSARNGGRAWWENRKSTSTLRSDSGEPPSESVNAAWATLLRRIDSRHGPATQDASPAWREDLNGAAEEWQHAGDT